MTWFRVDDGFSDHPKVDALGDGPCLEAAIALWTLSGAWAAKHLTDGFVPAGRVARVGVKNATKAAEELVRVGLWDREEDGYRFRNWCEYQPTRARVEAEREKTAERVRRHRDRPATEPTSVGNAVTPAKPEQRNAVTNAAPVPSRPVPSRPVPKSALALSERAPEFDLVEHALGEAKRIIGRAWGNPEQIHAAWRGGGLRTLHSDVDRLKAIVAWAAELPEPKAALTRSIEGYGATSDALVVKSNRSLALFASDPGRWMRSGSALSSAPSNFDSAGVGPKPGFLDDDIEEVANG